MSYIRQRFRAVCVATLMGEPSLSVTLLKSMEQCSLNLGHKRLPRFE